MSFESECWTGLMGVRQVLDYSVSRTLLDLGKTWVNSAKEERKGLVHIIIQEVGVDVAVNHIQLVKKPIELRAPLLYPGCDAP